MINSYFAWKINISIYNSSIIVQTFSRTFEKIMLQYQEYILQINCCKLNTDLHNFKQTLWYFQIQNYNKWSTITYPLCKSICKSNPPRRYNFISLSIESDLPNRDPEQETSARGTSASRPTAANAEPRDSLGTFELPQRGGGEQRRSKEREGWMGGGEQDGHDQLGHGE